jgi:hypothetical protein
MSVYRDLASLVVQESRVVELGSGATQDCRLSDGVVPVPYKLRFFLSTSSAVASAKVRPSTLFERDAPTVAAGNITPVR